MERWAPIISLRNYGKQHPPVAVFFLCMLTLAITFISFGSYVQMYLVKNPDRGHDWNTVLRSLADLSFCVLTNGTSPDREQETWASFSSSPAEHGDAAGIPATPGHPVFVHLFLKVQLALIDSNEEETLPGLRTSLKGGQLGFKGVAGNQDIKVTLLFYSQPEGASNSPGDDTGKGLTCLRITAPINVLPQKPYPLQCPVHKKPDSIHASVKVIGMDQDTLKHKDTQLCHRVKFTSDPSLTAMLSQEERNLAGQHLTLVSGALLTMCFALCFIVSISDSKSRRFHGNDPDPLTEPLTAS